MCEFSTLEEFIQEINFLLVNKKNLKHHVIRTHSRKLQTLGDLSFPLDIKTWNNLVDKTNATNILDYSNSSVESLKENSAKWKLLIERCEKINSNCLIFLDRPKTFKALIQETLAKNEKFGSSNLNLAVKLTTDIPDKDNYSLTDLKISLLKNVAENFLRFTNCNTENSKTEILLTTKSPENQPNIITCGPVLNEKRLKDTQTTAEEFYKQRTLDMRLMAEHKFGVRIRIKRGWEDYFSKLGAAAVVIEILQNKPSHSTMININNHYIKNASFILYNCARLSRLLEEFDERVASNIYPPLPPVESLAFDKLDQTEEWELLFVYILQFPQLIKSCIRDVINCKINVHQLVLALTSMTSLFSCYYRRVKILIEPRGYLFETLHCRIYLLKALEQVLHNALRLLDIEPVEEM